MVTWERAHEKRRRAVYGTARRSRPFEGIGRDLLQCFVLLLLLAAVVATRVYFTMPG